ncbi:hypothetical protein OAL27_04220, partial [Verrucomicrobiales bacterium]|nr:hypothetical protein [Verrucomicrobiales bacterium]
WTQSIQVYGRTEDPVGEKSQPDQLWKAQGNSDGRYSAGLDKPPTEGVIECRSRFGGMLN